MEFLNSVLPKTRAPSSYTRLWHIPSCSQTTNCTRFLTLTDHFAPLSRKNYADFLCSKLSSHSPLGHFFFLITENSSGFLHVNYLNQNFWTVFFGQKQEQPDTLPTPPPPPWKKTLFCGLWVVYCDLFLLGS